MLCRRYALATGAFLFLAVLLSLPAAAAAPAVNPATGQAGASCAAALPWEQPAAGSVDPLQPDQTSFVQVCTSTSCGTGNQCSCGVCHPACGTGQRYDCICQVCYNRCPSGYFFDDSICACAAI